MEVKPKDLQEIDNILNLLVEHKMDDLVYVTHSAQTSSGTIIGMMAYECLRKFSEQSSRKH